MATRTFEEISEERPRVSAKVDALRKAIADAEKLGDPRLVESLQMQFNTVCEESALIMVDTLKLPAEQRRAVCAAMENQRKSLC